MIMALKVGDVIFLKKKHPCGNNRFEIVRLGTDAKIRCMQCQHQLTMQRSILERKIKSLETGKQ